MIFAIKWNKLDNGAPYFFDESEYNILSPRFYPDVISN